MNIDQITKGKVKFLTLGCRLNQYETQAMRENLLGDGYREARDTERPDVFVINTCTVTADADKNSRYLIRKCQRENPNAKVVVTGCYVERDYKTVAKMPGVTHVVLNRQKPELADLLDSCTQLTFEAAHPALRSKADFVPLEISEFSGRVRANIKIQDGCNHACSFCKVVLVRGKSRSRQVADILEEAKRLRDHGYVEVVLTGIQLGAYGLDFGETNALSNLMEELSKIDGIERIRLSSIEPNDVTHSLIESMKHIPKVCHHLHIPLQSGSNQILKAMNRRYQREKYLELVNHLNEHLDSFILTTDVMVGFPEETDEDFRQTADLLLEARPFKLHIFPYSAREGTKAFSSKSPAADILQKRRNILLELEKKLRHEIQISYLGTRLKILIEDKTRSGRSEGRASNYLPVQVASPSLLRVGGSYDVEVRSLKEDILMGEIVL